MKPTDIGGQPGSNIFLIGMMGAGKSTVGPLVSRRLFMRWIDLDFLIEERVGLSVAKIWEKYGEKYFRAMEAETLESIVGEPAVVACGGGVVTYEKSRELLRKKGKCVYLRASPEELASRLWSSSSEERKDVSSRPLLRGVTSERQLRTLLAQIMLSRESLYESLADLVIDTDKTSPRAVEAAIVEWWNKM